MSDIIYFLTLVTLLGNNSFKVRYDAYNRLEISGKKSLLYVSLGEKSKDLEVATKCKVLKRKIKYFTYEELFPIIKKLEIGVEKNEPIFHYHELSESFKDNKHFKLMVNRSENILKSYPNVPWIDSLSDYFPFRRFIINRYLVYDSIIPNDNSSIPNIGGLYYRNYRKATRLLVIDLLLNGASESNVRRVLDDMTNRCKNWNGCGDLPCEQED